MVVQRMIAEVSVADSSSGPAVSCAAFCVGTAAITASPANRHGIKPAIIMNAKVRMKLFMSEGIDILRHTRLTQDGSGDSADNHGRHLRDVQPLHQVGERGQQRSRDRNAINHPMPAKDEPTDRERVACLSRVPGRLQRGCATPSKLTTGAAWCP